MLRKAVLALGRPQLFGFQDIGTVCAPAHFAPASIVRRFCAGTGYATGPLDERTFHRVADMTFEYLQDELDVFLEDNVPEGEISYEAGVMTLAVGNGRGTYVLNKQGPNLQIWSSSPVSGPVRYDWSDGHWRYARDGSELMSSLSKELTDLCGVPLTLTQPQDD